MFQSLFCRRPALALITTVVTMGCHADDPLPLDRLSLPEGFSIEVFAKAENARQLARGNTGVIYTGSRQAGKVHAVVDHDGDGHAESTYLIDEDLALPSGVAYRDGDLYVAAVSTIYRYRDIDGKLDAPPEPEVVLNDLPGERHHGWKHIEFGPDGYLYVPVGAPCNICDREEPFATILKLDVDDPQDRQIIARGVRNSVGFDWDPATGDFWFTDNGRDRLGDDIPPCELNHLSEVGQHFGYPYVHGDGIRDPEYGDAGEGVYRSPALTLGPHTAPLGMIFYTGQQLPETYRGDVLLAEHGSWNRSEEAGHIGYRLIHARRDAAGALNYEVFVDGWLNDDNSRWGRPVDLLQMPDGSLLISDDEAGVIYRLQYRADGA